MTALSYLQLGNQQPSPHPSLHSIHVHLEPFTTEADIQYHVDPILAPWDWAQYDEITDSQPNDNLDWGEMNLETDKVGLHWDEANPPDDRLSSEDIILEFEHRTHAHEQEMHDSCTSSVFILALNNY